MTGDGEPLEVWHGQAVAAWQAAWALPVLRIYRSVGSTNDTARAWAEAGAPQGATVLADEQLQGRGRRGRVWRSDAGQSLILSMVFRPEAGVESVLSLRLGLATALAIEEVVSLAVGLKWPNDLQVGGRKVGGMLCEGAVQGGRSAFVVAGTGVNVLQADDAWPAELAGQATSLAARTGGPVDLPRLAGRVVARWLEVLERDVDTLSAGELAAFRDRDVLAGRAVTVDGEPVGVVQGVAPDGALMVADAAGRARPVRSGTVRILETGDPVESGDEA